MTRVRQEGSLREVQGGTTIGAAPRKPYTAVILGVSGGAHAVVRMGCFGRKPLPVLLTAMTAAP